MKELTPEEIRQALQLIQLSLSGILDLLRQYDEEIRTLWERVSQLEVGLE